MQAWLKRGVLIGLFAVPLIPFIVANPLFFPFITGKNFAFRIIVEIVAVLWAMLALKDPSVRPKKSAMLYALGAFVVSLGISTVLAENPGKAFWSNFERMEGYITILHLGVYFLVASSILQTQKMWRAFWNTSIGVSVAVALYGVFQLAGVFTINQGGVRVDATFGNATYLAVYMLFHFFITLIALVEWKAKRWLQAAYTAALVLQGLMIFYTATRGTILGLIGGLFLSGLLFVIFSKGHQTMRKAGAALVGLILVVSGGFFLIKDSDFVRENEVLSRVASISLAEGQTRFTIWGMAWEGFKERPVFGWGQEGFNFVFNKYYKPSLYAQEPWFDRVHNTFLDWLITGGALGLLLYLSLFVVALWYLWKPGSGFYIGERVLITGLLSGYGFHNLFVFDNLMSYVLFLSLLAYLTARTAKESEQNGKAVRSGSFRTASGAVVVIMAVVLYTANVPGMTRAAGIIDALRPYETGLTENFEQFKKVIGPSGVGRQEAHEQLVQFASQIRNPQFASAATPEFRDEVAQFAIDRFGEEVERSPNDARLRIFYGAFLRQIGRFAEAERELLKALEYSPKKQNILFELGALASQQGDQDGMRSWFQEAYELDPSYDQARLYYAASLIRTGDAARSSELLIEFFGTATPDNNIILQAYLDAGDHASVVLIAESRAALRPADFNAYLELGAAYLEAERRADAVTALEKAIELNQDFRTQGDYYIGEIKAGRNP